jgi:hypothetical protein
MRSVSRVVGSVENCGSVAMDASVSTRGIGTEMGWSGFVGEAGS